MKEFEHIDEDGDTLSLTDAAVSARPALCVKTASGGEEGGCYLLPEDVRRLRAFLDAWLREREKGR